MRDYVIALAILGVMPLVLFRPFFGLLVWCWVAYMVPHKLGWGLTAHWPVAMAVGGLFMLGYLFSKEPKKLPMNSIVIVHLLMVLWWLVTFLVNDRTQYAWIQFDKIFKIQLFTFITIMLVNTRERLLQLIAVISLSIGFFGIKGGLFTLLTGGGSRVWGPPGGFFEGNNELGLALLTILPLLRFVQLQVSKKWQIHGLTAAMVLVFVAALGTQSRGALLAAIVMGTYFWWKSPHKLPITVAALVLLPLLYFFLPDSWHQRMATMKVDVANVEITRNTDTSTWCGQMTAKIQSHDPSAGGRVNAWCFAFNLAKHKFFGGGFDAFDPAAFERYAPDPKDFHDAHSLYFKILGEHGFVGLFLFLLLIAMAWFRALSIRRIAKRSNQEWAAQLADMLQVSLLAFCTGGVFLGLCYFDLLYHLIAIVVILDVLVHKQPAAATATGAAPVGPRFANALNPAISQGSKS
ncbi:putative O-glycosylation ligase, exosortase A system-associated [Permianibacter sp. IMCC34836]|uniref:putative O-glycosylation ligase, exosortase A system-associated n=1 Tax=Permianibacter fluminis TaxID=2738515 RepID=UPI00155387F5|nr:putative O-glycosylation ligase, exosortase A system-associated [Permianibacter fluminis]NQD35596.1 putative O-glycosylation ligase, exosortase A system-associated [Permianibacter fluminis]